MRAHLAARMARLFARVPADSVPRATVTDVYPATCSPDGGESIVLTGTGFRWPTKSPAYAVTSVRFGGVEATDVEVYGATELSCTAPAHAAGPVEIVVTIGGVTTVVPASFTYAT